MANLTLIIFSITISIMLFAIMVMTATASNAAGSAQKSSSDPTTAQKKAKQSKTWGRVAAITSGLLALVLFVGLGVLAYYIRREAMDSVEILAVVTGVVLLLSSMLMATAGTSAISDAEKNPQNATVDYKNANRYQMWAAIIAGISVFFIAGALILYASYKHKDKIAHYGGKAYNYANQGVQQGADWVGKQFPPKYASTSKIE